MALRFSGAAHDAMVAQLGRRERSGPRPLRPLASDQVLLLHKADNAVTATSGGEHRLGHMNLLEMKTRVMWILNEELIRRPGLLTSIVRKRR